MKYCITVVRYGSVFVEADDQMDAEYIAGEQSADGVYWEDDWDIVGVQEADDVDDELFIRE